MPSGEISQTTGSEASHEVVAASALPVGTVITNSGRVSSTRFPGQTATTPPFSRDELIALDDAIHAATEKALVRFSVYIGELGTDPVADARNVLLKAAPEPAYGTLLAVSPNTHDVVVVSGSEVADRINDRVADLGVTAAIGSFRQNELIDGLVSALHVMATAAAPI
ncbi:MULTISPECIES: DUF5130 family protein [Gordonia]|uniref:DUF5130 domain-containing protein n=1 Tax=Gordonia sputi NBRC 100414 TaxID=1089453 RepID=H5U4L9_9ACTN|nr:MULTISPECIES: DUF5130 family protein [Gordonia]NKY94013.1 DUF5130 domain-containing protein [Gordonia sputi]OBA42240.1 DUF5130 domain-containing protein [Gordonia sp. 852002-51296_SCH5728562-b]OBC08248.1 DUF5130 domain-containing protein [Gordonia sp. 852002-50395_SCH5434458]OBC12770.1 DUF5130 domain-containing protein [Gordonia sp. 852002-50816_SCH5313054-a]OBC18765.1 DUF5130 domain-containing protein [Gordonia sp. 852002-50816_SCH5313054-c]